MLLALALVLFGAYYLLVRGPSSETGSPTSSAGDPSGSSASRSPSSGDPDPLEDMGGPGEAAEAPSASPARGPERTVDDAPDDAVRSRPVAREAPAEPQEDEGAPSEPGAGPSAGDENLPAPDPLGRREEGRHSGELSGQRLSASNYVTYAFGYTGKDVDEYLKNVGLTVLEDEFYASAGGDYVEQTADGMREAPNGVRSAAILRDFRILGGEGEEYRAVLTFDVADAYGRTGLEGDTTRYRQEVRLAEWRRNYWKMKTAGPAVPE